VETDSYRHPGQRYRNPATTIKYNGQQFFLKEKAPFTIALIRKHFPDLHIEATKANMTRSQSETAPDVDPRLVALAKDDIIAFIRLFAQEETCVLLLDLIEQQQA
jgi:hypothetical protein